MRTQNPAITDIAASNSLTDLGERLKIEHAAVASAVRASLEHAMAAGDILIDAKQQLGHGQFLPWLESCDISERTAQRYMRLARNRALIEANPTPVSDLGVSGALALLSAPRQSSDDIANQLAGMVEAIADATVDFAWENQDGERERETHSAVLAEAKADVERIGELAAVTPGLAEIIDRDEEGFCQRIIEQSEEYGTAVMAAMGLTESEYETFAARIDALKAQGLDPTEIVFEIAFSGDLLDGFVPIPTAVVSRVRNTASDWLRWVEQRAEVVS